MIGLGLTRIKNRSRGESVCRGDEPRGLSSQSESQAAWTAKHVTQLIVWGEESGSQAAGPVSAERVCDACQAKCSLTGLHAITQGSEKMAAVIFCSHSGEPRSVMDLAASRRL